MFHSSTYPFNTHFSKKLAYSSSQNRCQIASRQLRSSREPISSCPALAALSSFAGSASASAAVTFASLKRPLPGPNGVENLLKSTTNRSKKAENHRQTCEQYPKNASKSHVSTCFKPFPQQAPRLDCSSSSTCFTTTLSKVPRVAGSFESAAGSEVSSAVSKFSCFPSFWRSATP